MTTITAIKKGDRAGIYCDGKLKAVGIAREPSAKQVRIYTRRSSMADAYSLRSQLQIGNKAWSFRPLMPDEAEAANAELEREAEELERAKEAERLAAYEALPESIKLARSLKWLCDCESEKKISGAPIEAMRAIVQWAIENKLTTE